MTAYSIRIYQTADRKRPFAEWVEGLTDARARARIQTRLARMALGIFGDHRAIGEGVFELRIDWGPLYRVYFGRVGPALVILLRGGDKAPHGKDIGRAKSYLTEFKARSQETPRPRDPYRGRHGKRRVRGLAD